MLIIWPHEDDESSGEMYADGYPDIVIKPAQKEVPEERELIYLPELDLEIIK